MLTIKEVIKTINNAFNQKLKKHRGNWEQNDPTANDYIKNRPFYADGYTTLIENKTFRTYNDYEFCSPFVFEITEGEVYKVVWNGKEYECVVYADLEGLYIGNVRIMGGNNDTGEPFFYAYTDYGGGNIEYFWCIENAGTHTVSVYEQNVKRIDKKYIPENATVKASIVDLYDYADYLNSSIANIPADVVRYGTSQSLTTAQKKTGKTNICAVGYDADQGLTDTNKAQARANIGAGTSNFSGSYNDLRDKPDIYQQYLGAVDISSPQYVFGNILDLDCGMEKFSIQTKELEVSYWIESTSATTGEKVYKYSDSINMRFELNSNSCYLIVGIDESIAIRKGYEEYLWFYNFMNQNDTAYKTGIGNRNLLDFTLPEYIGRNLYAGQICLISRNPGDGYYLYSNSNTLSKLIFIGPYSKIPTIDDNFIDKSIVRAPATASRGQVLTVKILDQYNKPTAWEATSLPSKVSELTNDVGYITEHQDLSDYALNSNVISTPTTGAIGQTLVVKSIDENGKPTEWETKTPFTTVPLNLVDTTNFGGGIQYDPNLSLSDLAPKFTSTASYCVMVTRTIMLSGTHQITVRCDKYEVVRENGSISQVILHFGDTYSPIIMDIVNNTIVVDPNWVAPTVE